ncbi:hypothetical protein ACLD9W_00540 [Neisseria sp. WLZKY-1]|uniref:hypothetical protein n=1 Tax=Neisseria sp. WLZKY-1 TaxID=3390377 RepID=UPI00397A4075
MSNWNKRNQDPYAWGQVYGSKAPRSKAYYQMLREKGREAAKQAAVGKIRAKYGRDAIKNGDGSDV